jgi:uncharacterized protein
VIVNEAGASIYSTSEIGREELPDASPSIRSAVSIGRRLQDPLSELVKISPANIGVGMYQHDVKARHLSESLDDVVQFCVNRVGVNVNSASPALLKYVSGLNALTAQRVYEYRKENGPFKSRQQLREVNGFGDATFLQAAGFLRIHEGDASLDVTAIHPESYSVAEQLMQKAGVTAEQLFPVVEKVDDSEAGVETAPAAQEEPSSNAEVDTSSTAEAPATTADQASADTSDAVVASANDHATEPSSTDPAAGAQPSSETPVEEEKPAEAEAESTSASASGAEVAVEADATAGDSSSNSAGCGAVSEAPKKPQRPARARISPEAAAARRDAVARLNQLDIEALAKEHSTGELLLKDIVLALKKPNWDPRDRLSRPAFRTGIIKADDLKPEMQLDAQVVNVVDFGVFVDIGLGESCLVHVSQLSHNFIRDPHDHYSIGQVLRVWVSEVDSDRRRVKLTAIRPGTKKPQRGGRKRSDAGEGGGRRSRPAGRQGGGKRGDNRGSGARQQRGQRSGGPRRNAKPKPVKPITDNMLKGKEPMRSFSDLAQFVSKKPEKDEKKD